MYDKMAIILEDSTCVYFRRKDGKRVTQKKNRMQL